MHLTRGGYVRLTTGSLKSAGVGGDFWSATAYFSQFNAYRFGFDSTNAVLSDLDDRYYGLTVRQKI